MMQTQARPVPNGSSTQTVTSTADRPPEAGPSRQSDDEPGQVGRLVLRGGPSRRQRVQWDQGTVDNEGMGKKKSKICCIYHKPRPFDESSSESGSDSDSSCDHDHGRRHRRHRPERPSPEPNGSGREAQRSPDATTTEHRPPAPNAYDADPSDKGKGGPTAPASSSQAHGYAGKSPS